RHFSRGALASMVLLEDPARKSLYSVVGTNSSGQICALPRVQTETPARTGIFTGIHVLENIAFNYLKAEPCGINEVLYPTLLKNSPDRVFGDYMENAYWQ